jgi:hypothetical protein
MSLMICSIAFSQDINDKVIKCRIPEVIAQLNDYISFIADKKQPLKKKMHYKEKALNLFIGKGYGYEEDGVKKEGVILEVASKNRKQTRRLLIRNYLDNLINRLGGYSDVKITAPENANMKLSELIQVSPNLWVCECEFNQAFEGIRDGRLIYRDITTKRIKCYVTAEETEDGREFVCKLGNVYAIDTE